MLAKIWKKLLLAVCIIAILFNITSKLVNRISLEKAISSTPEGVNLKEVLNITEEQKTVTDETEKNISRYKTVEEVEAERAAREAQEKDVANQEVEEQEVIDETEKEKSAGGQIIDIVTDAVTNAKEQASQLY